jgi:hypothetical protein
MRNPPHTPVQNQQMQQMRNGNRTPQANKGQQSYARGKVMHVDAEVAQENPRVMLGMFLVNSTLALVLFDSGASHSFITSHFVAQHNIPISPMPRHKVCPLTEMLSSLLIFRLVLLLSLSAHIECLVNIYKAYFPFLFS